MVATLPDGNDSPSIYPNPTSDVLNVAFTRSMDKPVGLVILDALGRTVAVVNMDVMSEQRAIQVPIDRLARGWYNLSIYTPDGTCRQSEVFLKK